MVYTLEMNPEIFVYIIVIAIIGLCGYIYFERSDFQLKCVVSTVDGNKYCVKESADMLAKVTEKCKKLVAYVGEKFPDQDNVKRLVDGFNPKKVMETLPTSEFTAYSENKGEKLAFCLNTEKGGSTMIDEHTLMFVAIHELSHIATKSIGHKTEFWENFKFLLEQAKAAGIHTPRDYKKEPQKYCGMTIKDSPAFDL